MPNQFQVQAVVKSALVVGFMLSSRRLNITMEWNMSGKISENLRNGFLKFFGRVCWVLNKLNRFLGDISVSRNNSDGTYRYEK